MFVTGLGLERRPTPLFRGAAQSPYYGLWAGDEYPGSKCRGSAGDLPGRGDGTDGARRTGGARDAPRPARGTPGHARDTFRAFLSGRAAYPLQPWRHLLLPLR